MSALERRLRFVAHFAFVSTNGFFVALGFEPNRQKTGQWDSQSHTEFCKAIHRWFR